MFNRMVEALENFCIHQIRSPHRVEDDAQQLRTIIASIDIAMAEDTTYRVYLALGSNFAQRVALALLEEDESDEQTLVDMTLESANLVVGSAKVLLSDMDKKACKISTPTYHKLDNFDMPYDEAKTLYIEKDHIIIAIKEI